MSEFRSEISVAINRHSKENGSNTPDFILAEYLEGCLELFDRTVVARKSWFRGDHEIGVATASEGRKRRVVETLEELEALPYRSVVRTDNSGIHYVCERLSDGHWYAVLHEGRVYPLLPATVIYTPEGD